MGYYRMTFEDAVQYARDHGPTGLMDRVQNGWHDPDANRRARLAAFVAAATHEAERRGGLRGERSSRSTGGGATFA